MLKVYVPYTSSIADAIGILSTSASGMEEIDVIPTLYQGSDSEVGWGETGEPNYMDLMIERWRILPDLIKKNYGRSIVWLDADCVFNNNNKEFATTILHHLETSGVDFAFQRDTNRRMSNRINMGIYAVKCSHKTREFVKEWFEEISTKEIRQAGFPQTEWNDYFTKHAPSYFISFCLLPESFGKNTGKDNCVIYHAIGTKNKVGSMKSALEGWGWGDYTYPAWAHPND